MNIHQCLRARYPASGLLAMMAVCGLRSAHLFAAPLRVDSESPMIGSTPLVFPPPAPKEGMVADAGSIAAAVRDLSNANVGTRQAAVARLYWIGPQGESAVRKLANEGSGEAALLARRVIGMWQHTERTASGFWGINIFQSTQFRLWMRG